MPLCRREEKGDQAASVRMAERPLHSNSAGGLTTLHRAESTTRLSCPERRAGDDQHGTGTRPRAAFSSSVVHAEQVRVVQVSISLLYSVQHVAHQAGELYCALVALAAMGVFLIPDVSGDAVMLIFSSNHHNSSDSMMLDA